MVRRVAVAWALTLAVAASASAQSGSSGTSTAQSPTGTQTPSSSTRHDGRHAPATTTFFGDTGLWFVPTAEVLAHGKWSVERLPPRHQLHPGLHQRRRLRRHVRRRHQGPRRGLRLVPVRHAHRPRPAAALHQRPERRRHRRSLSAGQPAAGRGDNVGDFYVGAKVNLLSRVPAEAGGAGRARDREAADRRRGRRRRHRARPTSSSTSSPARKRRRWSRCRATRGYEFRGKPDGFDAPSGAFRWGAGAGFPSRSPLRGVARAERRHAVAATRRRSPATLIVGDRRQPSPPIVSDDREPDARDGRR